MSESSLRRELHSILSAPLVPEHINTYASDALARVIDFTGKVVARYTADLSEAVGPSTAAEVEDRAFRHFGLQDVNEILEHLAVQDETIRAIGLLVLGKLQHPDSDTVLVPPGDNRIPRGEPNNTGKEPNVPRLQTILYLLQETFEVNLEEEVLVSAGPTTSDMVRQTSYVLVDVPRLERSILVCDEIGNTTYVFDRTKLREVAADIDPLALRGLTKDELETLIRRHPGAGIMLHYTDTFVSRITAALSSINVKPKREPATLLYPKAPEGTRTIGAFIKVSGYSDGIVRKTIKQLREDDSLGTIGTYDFGIGGGPYDGLNPGQQAFILARLAEKYQDIEPVKDGERTLTDIGRDSGLKQLMLQRAIDELNLTGRSRIVSSNIRTCYSPAEQEQIIAQVNRYPFREVMVSLGFRYAREIARNLGVGSHAVQGTIKRLDSLDETINDDSDDKFGSATKGRDASGKVVPYYSGAQQEKIRLDLEKRGLLAQKAPEGARTIAGLTEALGIGRDKLEGYLGRWERAGSAIKPEPMVDEHGRAALYFTPEKITVIAERIQSDIAK